MDHALKVIPAAEISSTPLFLYATAGMRLLPAKQRDDVLAATCRFFRTNYKFHLPDCAAHIQMISGEWEGIYGWVAINQLLDGFVTDETLGFLDMGGASTQITFEPTAEIRTQHANDMMPVKLRTLGGKELSYSVYTTTFLGYGMNEARRRYVSWLVERAQKQASGLAKEVGGKQAALAAEDKSVITTATGSPRLARRAEADSAHVEPREEKPAPNEPGPSSAHSPPSSSHSLRKMEGTLEAAPNVTASANRWTVLDPCLPKGATIKDREHQSTAVAKLNPTLEGTGSFAQCVLTTIPLLNKTAPCPDEPCLFNGVHIPGGAPGRRPDMHFIGISEYWYTVENVFMLGGDYSYKDFANAARTFCGQDWNVTMQRFKSGKYPHVHDVEKLEFQCFKAAWLVNFLHEGLGIPKEFLADEDKDDMVPLRSVNEISGLQISWTLGVMVIFAAGTVPPAEAPGTWTKMSLAATLAVPMALLGVCFFAVFLMWGQGRKRIFTHRNSTVEFPLARRHPRSGSEGSSLLHPHGDIETGNGQESFDAEESVFAPKAGKMPDAFNHGSGVDRRGSPKPIGEEWAPKLARTTSFLGRGSPRPPNSPSRKGSVRQ
jgi:Golgi nucleoside diphosphatase